MEERIKEWPSGTRDTTEFPEIKISIDVEMRDHLQAFCDLDGIAWDNYDLQRETSGLKISSQRLRTYRKMYERLGLIYRDEDKIRLSKLGREMGDLQSTLEAMKRSMTTSAVDILARYQFRNPIDGPNLPTSCNVQPYLCIWKAMRGLDNKINNEEMNRVILHVATMDDIDGAVQRIKSARTVYGNYTEISSSELDEVLGKQVHSEQPSARIAPWFSSAGWGGLIIEAEQRDDGYRWLTSTAIDIIDSKLDNPPDFFLTEDKEAWLHYYIGKETTDVDATIDICLTDTVPTGSFSIDVLPNDLKTDYSRRYITSLLAKPFVILTGNSGTGKTRISKRFAKYLEVRDEDGEPNWLLVPVGADWTDNTKVLGFFNPLADGGKGAYEETGILKLIKRANAHPDVPYFLILDEMNLSHVERYFADLLSHMETIGEDNLIVLDGYENKDADEADSAKLPYPKNLFVIGTVNIDETTYMFSPKVLDRANVIEFKPGKEDVLRWFTAAEGAADITIAASGVAQSFLRLAEDIRGDNDHISSDDFAAITEKFGKLYDALEICGFEFAYRTVREVRRYVNAAHEFDVEGYDLRRAIDEQIVQKILPKLHGSRREIGDLLDELTKLCDGELSSAKIGQMKTRLKNVQYTSFI